MNKIVEEKKFGVWTCPFCEKDCDVETYTKSEILLDEYECEYKVELENIDKCLSCESVLEHNCSIAS